MVNLLAFRRSGVTRIKQNARNSSTGTLTPKITCFQRYLSNGTLVSRDSKSQVRQGGAESAHWLWAREKLARENSCSSLRVYVCTLLLSIRRLYIKMPRILSRSTLPAESRPLQAVVAPRGSGSIKPVPTQRPLQARHPLCVVYRYILSERDRENERVASTRGVPFERTKPRKQDVLVLLQAIQSSEKFTPHHGCQRFGRLRVRLLR
jgi:hypothetical protein